MSLNRYAVRVRLRNDRTLSGRIHMAEGQSLATLLGTKLYFLNLTDVQWAGPAQAEPLPHVSIRLEQIIWVEPLDSSLALTSAALPSEEIRNIELQVGGAEGWGRIHVQMNVARETRMTDYLDANPGFIPLWAVRVVDSDETIERVALNHSAIGAIRELDETDPRQRGR